MTIKKQVPVKRKGSNQYTKAKERAEQNEKMAREWGKNFEKATIHTAEPVKESYPVDNGCCTSYIGEGEGKSPIVEKILSEKLYELLRYHSPKEQSLSLAAVIQRLDADKKEYIEITERRLSEHSQALIIGKNERESFLSAISNATQNI